MSNKSTGFEPNGRQIIESAAFGTYLRAHNSDGKVDMASGPVTESDVWTIENRGGTSVVFSTTTSPVQYLRAEPDNHVGLSEVCEGCEHWTLANNEDGSWSFKSAHGRWLSPLSFGSLTTVENCDPREHFWLQECELVQDPSDSRRRFKSRRYGTYLSARDQKVSMVAGPPEETENWIIDNDKDGKSVVIKTSQTPTKYLSARPDGLFDLTDEAKGWEKWSVRKYRGGPYAFKSTHGKWLSAVQEGSVKARHDCDLSEEFELEQW